MNRARIRYLAITFPALALASLALSALALLGAPSPAAADQGRRPAQDSRVSGLAEPPVDPNFALGTWVHLPILDYVGDDDACSTWIEIQAVGAAPMKAVLVVWGEPGFCPPQAAGPNTVMCTGLLRPGSTWVIPPEQIPPGSRSGVLHKLSVRRLSSDGLDVVFGFDAVYADLLCDWLFYGMMSSSDYQRFRKAYHEGGMFGGMPMDLAAGFDEGGVLAVDVRRDCPAPGDTGQHVTSTYTGRMSRHVGDIDPVQGGYTTHVPLVYADETTLDSWVYIQNAGIECSTVELWLKSQDDCTSARICELTTLASNETVAFNASACVGKGWQGAGWIRSSQPLAVVVDIVGPSSLMTYAGEPTAVDYLTEPSCLVDPFGDETACEGDTAAFGPLVYAGHRGWDSAVHVQNLSPTDHAKIKVILLDQRGEAVSTLVDWICPRGSTTLDLQAVHDLPAGWVGSVRVESQPGDAAGGTTTVAPSIAGVVTLTKRGDGAATETQGAVAYALLREHMVFEWPFGGGDGGLESGAGLIAIPSLTRVAGETGQATELAVVNAVPVPGITFLAVFLYDQNGFVDYLCEDLVEEQVAYIDLGALGFLGGGFKGTAIVSALFWEHDHFHVDGRFLRNVVGLGAMSVVRPTARPGGSVTGDAATGTRGVPLLRSDVVDEERRVRLLPDGPFPDCYKGPRPPGGPGDPGS